MKVQIDGFPHAQYFPEKKLGFLVYYYPYEALRDSALTNEQWRNNSYSPEILDFKEGKEHAFQIFLSPLLKLIEYILKTEHKDRYCLVPAPSSILWNDPQFKRTPRAKGELRNRDNRNEIFCEKIASKDQKLQVANILRRIKSKQPKETWNANQHASSFEIINDPKLSRDFSGIFVVIDDVVTNGGTLDGIALVLQSKFPQSTIIRVAIGQTRSPVDFLSLQ